MRKVSTFIKYRTFGNAVEESGISAGSLEMLILQGNISAYFKINSSIGLKQEVTDIDTDTIEILKTMSYVSIEYKSPTGFPRTSIECFIDEVNQTESSARITLLANGFFRAENISITRHGFSKDADEFITLRKV